MSYFDRLEAKLRDVERQSKAYHENLLKFKDLAHKAEVAKKYNELQQEYLDLKQGLQSTLKEEKELLDHHRALRKDIEQTMTNLKREIREFNEQKRRMLDSVRTVKESIRVEFRKEENLIYQAAEYLFKTLERIENKQGENSEYETNLVSDYIFANFEYDRIVPHPSQYSTTFTDAQTAFEKQQEKVQGTFNQIKDKVQNSLQ
ncbi:MAG: hypothetical protein AAFZ15_33305 [Bacteroidota bacterium]